MANLVFESLDELFEAKKAVKEEKPAKEDKPKGVNMPAAKAKIEKEKPKKVKQGTEEKANQAIAGLKAELVKAKKPGAFKTTAQKNAKIKELGEKIAAWEKKIK
jgi:hypothetical protein